MESKLNHSPLVVIVGETASGKSSLALKLAKKFDGEIISADSRTIYKGMDIGTAKPGELEQTQVRHHLLDIVEPDRIFNAAEFKNLATSAIEDIHRRGKLPIMVGGTGLYVDAILYDFAFSQPGSERDPKNPRHLKSTGTISRRTLRPNTLIIGLKADRDELEKRIEKRVEAMFKRGLVSEVERLSNVYGWEAPGLQAIGYKEFKTGQTPEETKMNIIRHTLQYAKRQRTWFKRNKSIHWKEKQIEAVELTTTFLNKNTA